MCNCSTVSRLINPLNKDETCRESSLTLTFSHYSVIKTMFMYFVYGTLCHEDGSKGDRKRNVIPSLEIKTSIINPKFLLV